MKTTYTSLITILASILIASNISADLIAYTEDGRKVLLKDNGTWEFIKEDKQKDDSSHDFRKTRWGMSITEVKSTETGKLLQDTSIDSDKELVYAGKVAGVKCNIHYGFTHGTLTSAAYDLKDRHSNYHLYIRDYNKITEILDKKYGKSQEKKAWRNPKSIYREPAHRNDGMAIAIGDLLIGNQWETINTTISAYISGNNFRITTLIGYESKTHKKQADKKAETEDLADF